MKESPTYPGRHFVPCSAPKNCSGWVPSSGANKGKGGSCGKWGQTFDWCYVDHSYAGPGHEYIKPSKDYPGKFFSFCGGGANTANASGKSPEAAKELKLQ